MAPGIGLVFDGGGAKGAYQIGVWKAMHELGLDRYVTAIAGTSVGGLNAALFIQDDLNAAFNKAYYIWTKEIKNIRPLRIQMDLSKIIEKKIDITAFSRSKIDCFLSVYHPGQSGQYYETSMNGQLIEKYVNNEMTYYNLRCISQKKCRILFDRCSTSKAIMLATSALPLLCHQVLIDHKPSMDGGVPWGGDNSPVYPLSWSSSGCDVIILVHLSHLKDSIKKELYSGIKIFEIVPNVSPDKLGFFNGTINFDPNYSNYMIEAGYIDSLGILRRLKNNFNSADAEAYIENEITLFSNQKNIKKQERLQRLSELIKYNEWIDKNV